MRIFNSRGMVILMVFERLSILSRFKGLTLEIFSLSMNTNFLEVETLGIENIEPWK